MTPGLDLAGMGEFIAEKAESVLSGGEALLERLSSEGEVFAEQVEAVLPDGGGEALLERLSREREYTFRLPDGYIEGERGFKRPDDGGENTAGTKVLDGDKTDLRDSTIAKLDETLSNPEKLQELLDKHPEVCKKIADAVNTLNDPEASDLEVEIAKRKLDINYKGELLEIVVKDTLAQLGFDVADKQKIVEGESGGTKPDVIAYNNTDHPIKVFGIVVRSSETFGVECKCGREGYLSNQLKNHIPNQLSGHEGHSVLLTTSNIKNVNPALVNSVCSKYGTTLVTLGVSAADVENAMKGVKS